jgi:hypothetical protein
MPIRFSDIEDAFLFVSSDSYGMHSALVNPETGQTFYRSEAGDLDEIGEMDLDNLIQIPHKNDLDLGKELVFRFVGNKLPDDYERVGDIFARRGAYGRFKDFLESKGLLEEWYRFEDEETKTALRQWCEDNELMLSD